MQSRALALPFCLGLGMAIPWPIAGAGIAALPKPGMWMVRVKQAFGVLILVCCCRLAASSSSTPSKAQARQMALRTAAAFSPTPAVKTIPSIPPSADASELISRAVR